jgi:hypothetical protein
MMDGFCYKVDVMDLKWTNAWSPDVFSFLVPLYD